MSPDHSPLEQIHEVIQTHNPFRRELTVRQQEVWGTGFPDVPSINAHASDAVFEAIENVRSGSRQVMGITLLADPGGGKTHLISRIRHRLQANGGAWFIYMDQYANLNQISLEFLKTLATSLKKTGSKNVMQWQELAANLVNHAEAEQDRPEEIVEKVQSLENPAAYIEALTDCILDLHPDIENPDLVKAILWTLSKNKHYAINWLSGRSLAQNRAEQLQLANPSEEQRENEIFEMSCQILDLVSYYNPLVICFDRFDSQEVNDAGYTRLQVVADFCMDLYDKLKKGVLITAVYPEIWITQLKAMTNPKAIEDRIAERKIDLDVLDGDSAFNLIGTYLSEFYQQKNLTPPHPVYPFDRDRLIELGKQKAIARNILKWCRDNWSLPNADPGSQDREPQQNPVESALNNEIEQVEADSLLDNEPKIAKSLRFCFERLVGFHLENVTIKEIEKVNPPNKYVDFKIVGEENGQMVKIGIAVLQASGGTTVTAGLSHLGNYQKYDLTRGCVVRSKEVSPNARRAREYLNRLLEKQGGEWVTLKFEEIKPLVAIAEVYEGREDYGLSDAQIFDYIAETKFVETNPLILEILSDPSGQIPDDVEEDN
jgi:hypothetical protein